MTKLEDITFYIWMDIEIRKNFLQIIFLNILGDILGLKLKL